MAKKTLVLALVLVLMLSGTGVAFAQEEEGNDRLSPADPFYDATLAINESQLNLTDDLLEKVYILSEMANQLIEAIENEFDGTDLEQLLSDLEAIESVLDSVIEKLLNDEDTGEDETGEDKTGQDETGEDETGDDESGDDETGEEETGGDETGDDETGDDETGDDEDEMDDILEGKKVRGWRLREKVADETLPAHVRANAQKALDNMARAMANHERAKQRKAERQCNGDDGVESPDEEEPVDIEEENEDEELEEPTGGESDSPALTAGEEKNQVNQDMNQDKNQDKLQNKDKNNKEHPVFGSNHPGGGRDKAPGQQKKNK